MAIIKHVASQNRNYSDVVDYLTMQHDKETGTVILDTYGERMEREGYLIQGINCSPEDFAEHCIRDRFHFGVKGYESEITTHQYIVSFDPKDADRGLTVEMAQEEGIQMAQKYFPGHRTIVCTHSDGASHSGNIHVHIVISALRFEDQIPEESYMRLRPDGSVKPSEYKAGYRHQDTARLRLHMQAHVQEYCRQNGFTVTPSQARKKISSQEYKAGEKVKKRLEQDNALRKQNGIKPVQTTTITRKEELRRVISDAASTTSSWEAFAKKLQTGYSRPVEHRAGIGPIPYPVKKKLWESYKDSKQAFWKSYKSLSDNCSNQLEAMFKKLRTHQQNRPKSKSTRSSARKEYNIIAEELQSQIAALKTKQRQIRLTSQIYQTYTRAAALALSNGMEEEARICLEQMDMLTGRLEGRWTDGWNINSASHSLRDGKVQSCATWMQSRKSELDIAEKLLAQIQKEIRRTERIQPEIVEEPFPVEVKITRGVISFKHPDMEHWVRGKTLGTEFELEALNQALRNHDVPVKDISR